MAALRIIGNSVGRRERLDLHFYVAHPDPHAEIIEPCNAMAVSREYLAA